MKQLLTRPIPSIVAVISLFGALASIFGLEGMKLAVALIVVVPIVSGSIAYSWGRGIRSKREEVLDELGVIRVYATAKEDDAYLSRRLEKARKIRILAMNAEMLLRNLPMPLKNALKSGANLEVLVSRPDSELVREMEEMELADGRGPGRSIEQCIRDTEPELLSLIRESLAELPRQEHHRLGPVSLAYFNTQYRETMIICDDDWVWWTPHLNPARGHDRPTFVFQGQQGKLTRLCIRHFEAVKKMLTLKELQQPDGEVVARDVQQDDAADGAASTNQS